VARGQWRMRQIHGVRPFPSADPDSSRIWWEDGGVNQNLTFPVQPDPLSGQHCWHQKVRVTRAGPDDRYGDGFVDTNKSPVKDGSRVGKLDLPLIAENGAVVPVSVDVTSPMTPANRVKTIYVVADKNRIPVVFRAALGPEAGQAAVGATIRLGETGDVRAIVEQSDGTLLAVKREVKVTVGGCGG